MQLYGEDNAHPMREQSEPVAGQEREPNATVGVLHNGGTSTKSIYYDWCLNWVDIYVQIIIEPETVMIVLLF